jgi:hypothetical protein
MQRYLWYVVAIAVILIIIWLVLAIVAATRDPRDLPQEPPATRIEVAATTTAHLARF